MNTHTDLFNAQTNRTPENSALLSRDELLLKITVYFDIILVGHSCDVKLKYNVSQNITTSVLLDTNKALHTVAIQFL